jgi:hypothetical protein
MVVVWIILFALNINQNHDNHLTTNVYCMDSPIPLEEVCMTVTRNESGSYESRAEFIRTNSKFADILSKAPYPTGLFRAWKIRYNAISVRSQNEHTDHT